MFGVFKPAGSRIASQCAPPSVVRTRWPSPLPPGAATAQPVCGLIMRSRVSKRDSAKVGTAVTGFRSGVAAGPGATGWLPQATTTSPMAVTSRPGTIFGTSAQRKLGGSGYGLESSRTFGGVMQCRSR